MSAFTTTKKQGGKTQRKRRQGPKRQTVGHFVIPENCPPELQKAFLDLNKSRKHIDRKKVFEMWSTCSDKKKGERVKAKGLTCIGGNFGWMISKRVEVLATLGLWDKAKNRPKLQGGFGRFFHVYKGDLWYKGLRWEQKRSLLLWMAENTNTKPKAKKDQPEVEEAPTNAFAAFGVDSDEEEEEDEEEVILLETSDELEVQKKKSWADQVDDEDED